MIVKTYLKTNLDKLRNISSEEDNGAAVSRL